MKGRMCQELLTVHGGKETLVISNTGFQFHHRKVSAGNSI